jgi:hypothetical protein
MKWFLALSSVCSNFDWLGADEHCSCRELRAALRQPLRRTCRVGCRTDRCRVAVESTRRLQQGRSRPDATDANDCAALWRIPTLRSRAEHCGGNALCDHADVGVPRRSEACGRGLLRRRSMGRQAATRLQQPGCHRLRRIGSASLCGAQARCKFIAQEVTRNETSLVFPFRSAASTASVRR